MRGQERGFSLIEVLVAMIVLAMAFSVLFSISSRSLDGMRRAQDVERRIEFARSKLDELRLISDLQTGDRAEGTLDEGTHWSIEVLPFVEPIPEGVRRNLDSVVRVRFSLEWKGRNEPQTWTIDSYRLVHPRTAGLLHASLEEQLRAIASR